MPVRAVKAAEGQTGTHKKFGNIAVRPRPFVSDDWETARHGALDNIGMGKGFCKKQLRQTCSDGRSGHCGAGLNVAFFR